MEKRRAPSQPAAKRFYRVREVSALVGVPAYVLRFWEGQFSRLRPKRTPAGQRLYRARDLELFLQIKDLLHVQKYTIEGARRLLASRSADGDRGTDPRRVIAEIRRELQQIRRLLETPPNAPEHTKKG